MSIQNAAYHYKVKGDHLRVSIDSFPKASLSLFPGRGLFSLREVFYAHILVCSPVLGLF